MKKILSSYSSLDLRLSKVRYPTVVETTIVIIIIIIIIIVK